MQTKIHITCDRSKAEGYLHEIEKSYKIKKKKKIDLGSKVILILKATPLGA